MATFEYDLGTVLSALATVKLIYRVCRDSQLFDITAILMDLLLLILRLLSFCQVSCDQSEGMNQCQTDPHPTKYVCTFFRILLSFILLQDLIGTLANEMGFDDKFAQLDIVAQSAYNTQDACRLQRVLNRLVVGSTLTEDTYILPLLLEQTTGNFTVLDIAEDGLLADLEIEASTMCGQEWFFVIDDIFVLLSLAEVYGVLVVLGQNLLKYHQCFMVWVFSEPLQVQLFVSTGCIRLLQLFSFGLGLFVGFSAAEAEEAPCTPHEEGQIHPITHLNANLQSLNTLNLTRLNIQ